MYKVGTCMPQNTRGILKTTYKTQFSPSTSGPGIQSWAARLSSQQLQLLHHPLLNTLSFSKCFSVSFVMHLLTRPRAIIGTLKGGKSKGPSCWICQPTQQWLSFMQ